MPSPLVHTGLALGLWLALGLRGWRSALVVTVAASAPDVDLVFRLFGPAYMTLHHGATHSWVGATVLGLGTAAVAARFQVREARLVPACLLAALSHLPTDWSTGTPDSPKHFGIEAFWPFSTERFIDPHPFFGAFGLDQDGFLLNLLTPEALPLYGRELSFAGVMITLGAVIKASTQRARSRAP